MLTCNIRKPKDFGLNCFFSSFLLFSSKRKWSNCRKPLLMPPEPLVVMVHVPRNNSFPISLNGKAHDTAVVLAWLGSQMNDPGTLSVPGIWLVYTFFLLWEQFYPTIFGERPNHQNSIRYLVRGIHSLSWPSILCIVQTFCSGSCGSLGYL